MKIKMKILLFAVCLISIFTFCNADVQAKQVEQKANKPTGSLAKFMATDDVGEVYSKAIVDLKKNKVSVDGVKSDLHDVLKVPKEKEEKILDLPAKKFVNYIENNSVCEAEMISKTQVVITNNFQTKRIIAAVDDIKETYNATNVVKGITAYILKYDSEENTKKAYNKLVETYGDDKIFYDEINEIDETVTMEHFIQETENDEAKLGMNENINACAIDESSSNTDSSIITTGGGYIDTAKTLGLYNINNQIDNSKYSGNKVTVAVIDTGLTYTTNPNCEIGIKLRDKLKSEWCCAFGGTPDAGDDNGHGTMVSSVIAYNTPSNVQYCMFKVADSEGHLSTSSIFAAFEQAYIYDIDVVSISISAQYRLGYENVRQYDAILKKLYEKGVIVCCSAGNDANHKVITDNNGNIIDEYDTSANCSTPANSDYVLCISALNASNNSLFAGASYTNTGSTIDYSAIGSNVYVYTKNSTESSAYGTSFSTPLVAAEFAMFKTCNDCYKSVPEMRAFYDLYLNSFSRTTNSSLPKYLSNFPYFTGFSAHSLVK